jgi:hypothetical protein
MDREAMDALRHDRRLAHRRGWISEKDAKAAEEALPDCAAKSTTLGEAVDASENEPPADAPSADAPALPQL